MAAITAAVVGVAGSVYASKQAKKQQQQASKDAAVAMEKADPYAKYRDSAAQRLNDLMSDPNSVSSTPTFAARLQAAQRASASQGFTGSGNALVAAADAGAAAYQQEFDNLAMLSGAAQGTGNATAAYSASTGAKSAANDNYLGSTAGVVNNLTNLVGKFNKTAET